MFAVAIFLFFDLFVAAQKQPTEASTLPATTQHDFTVSHEGSPTRPHLGENSPAVDLRPVANLAKRVAPWLAKDLVLIPIPPEHAHEVFDLQTAGGKLIV